MDTPIFYIFLFIHLVSLVIGFGAVIVIDTFGLLWFLKKVKIELVNSVANITQRLIWVGWCGLVISGTILLLYKGSIDSLTTIKLFLVLMLGLNGIFLHFIKKSFEKLQGDNIPPIIMFRMSLASAISQLGWWGAITIGFLHRHWQHNISWPANPWIYIFGIVFLIGLVASIGENKFDKDK